MPPSWIKNNSRRINEYLDRVDDASMKRFIRLAGGPVSGRRADFMAWIEKALDQPERMKNAVQALRPGERSILAILRDLGGESDDNVLRAAAYGAGMTFLGDNTPKHLFYETLSHLVKCGMALNWNDYYNLTRVYQSEYGGQNNAIFSDDRILVHTGLVSVTSPNLAPIKPGSSTMARMPHLITMQMVGLLQAIERSGGIGLTQAGELRAVDVRKIAKAANWPEADLTDGPLVFRSALTALISALRNAGVLRPATHASRLLLASSTREFTDQPLYHLVRSLLLGLLKSSWTEDGQKHRSSDFLAARAALFYMLTSLPAHESGPFYSINELDNILFGRVGTFLSLNSTLYRPSFLSILANRSEHAASQEDINRVMRREWLKNERIWLEKAFSSWLYFLGVVELSFKDDKIHGVRLTDLGRAALHPELDVVLQSNASPASEGPAWVIQPNFDIIAYLDRLNTSQLAFLERHADRRSAQEHLAEYHLTRDSVYRGLEGGTRPDELLAELALGSGRDLPQNITTEVREWANQREHLTLWRRANLAEFPSAPARELAIRAGLTGKLVGERYLLLPVGPNRPLSRIFKQTVNYDQSPQRNLLVSEDGVISYHHPIPDLLLQARLDAWSEPHPSSGGRVFTRASVQSATASGRSVSSLLKLIDERQYKILPPLVRVSLRAWSGEKFSTGLEPVTILRTGSSELTYAFQQSDLLRPLLISTITPGIFLVRPEKVEELRAILRSLGLEGSK